MDIFSEMEYKKQILKFMHDSFMNTVNEEEKTCRDYYWKWICTSKISDFLKIDLGTTRRIMKKMEINGILHSTKESGTCLWAITNIDGFEQHYFKDYYQRKSIQ